MLLLISVQLFDLSSLCLGGLTLRLRPPLMVSSLQHRRLVRDAVGQLLFPRRAHAHAHPLCLSMQILERVYYDRHVTEG